VLDTGAIWHRAVTHIGRSLTSRPPITAENKPWQEIVDKNLLGKKIVGKK
jgi:hypothetical protein